MKYFVDTEFIDDGHTIDLISIGIVAEDGSELYLQSAQFYPHLASDWVKQNVFTHLTLCRHVHTRGKPSVYVDLVAHEQCGQCVEQNRGRIHDCPWRTRIQIREEVKRFIGPEKPEFYGWCCAYDWVALCQLFGTMMDLPHGWPHYMRDIQQSLDKQSIDDSDLPQQAGQAHNALADARYIKQIWDDVLS